MDRLVGDGPAIEPIQSAASPREVSATASLKLRVPTRGIILALVAVLIIPGILFAGFLLMRFAESERARYELEGIGVARGAATAIDRHLQGLTMTLQTLALSNALANDDLEGLYQQAVRVKSFSGVNIALRDAVTRQQIFNTRRPFGDALPRTPYSVDERAIDTGLPIVTNVINATTTGNPIVAIVLAVKARSGKPYLMHVSFDAIQFHEVVKQVTPPHWVIGVGDANGVYVTRSSEHERVVGKPGAPEYLSKAVGHEGTFIGPSAGRPALVGYSHTAIGNWVVGANIPQAVVEASLTEALYFLSAFGVAILIASSLIALWLWRFIARPLEGLAVASRAIGAGRAPQRVETSLREFVAVQDALDYAARQVRSHHEVLEAKVDERTRELAQVNTELLAQMTAREKAEAELRQFQKIEAVGQLTGGIAHDFNNMLSIVLSSLSLIQRRLDRGDTDVQRFVNSALEGVNRAKTLTARLLAFSRQQPLAPDVLDTNRLVAGMSELLRRTLGESIRIETVLAAGLWKTYADASQIENAIVNLCVNARDAMTEGGRLTIETANTYLDEDYCSANDGIKPGQYMQIAVTDTGSGMSADVAERAFDPFFTTKKTGMGTGLGLSQVYGFVKQSKGHIKIYSELGHGTTIKIYLPRHYGEETAQPVAALRRDAAAIPSSSLGECILVVEDEDRLRQLTADSLRELGYTVLQAGHAKEALELIDAHPEIDLLFTDIVMPDVNGRKLADEVQQRRPDIRVLYTTGFTRNAVVHNGILDTGVNFIPKPFTMEDLANKVRQILADVRSPAGAGGWH